MNVYIHHPIQATSHQSHPYPITCKHIEKWTVHHIPVPGSFSGKWYTETSGWYWPLVHNTYYATFHPRLSLCVPRGSIDLSVMYAIQWSVGYGHTTLKWSVELPMNMFWGVMLLVPTHREGNPLCSKPCACDHYGAHPWIPLLISLTISFNAWMPGRE